MAGPRTSETSRRRGREHVASPHVAQSGRTHPFPQAPPIALTLADAPRCERYNPRKTTDVLRVPVALRKV